MKNEGGSTHFDITGDNSDLMKKLAEARQGIINSGTEAEKQGAKIEQMFNRAGYAVAGFFSAKYASSFIKNIALVRGEFQQLEVAFTTILGSKEKADEVMATAVRTAATTPFDLQGVASGMRMLLAYGEDVETVNDTLIRLGNIAAGLSQPLGSIVYLYGTTMTQGRLFTQDLNQFTGRGIPMIKELAKQFGVAETEVKDLVSAGKIGFPEVQKVIKKMTDEGGMFFNLMENQSKTITGKISNIEDAIDTAFNELGKSSEGVINTALDGVSYLVENYEKVGRTILELVGTYGTYKVAMMTMVALQRLNIKLLRQATLEKHLAAKANIILSNSEAIAAAKTKLFSIAQNGLLASLKSIGKALVPNPYVLVAAAVAGLAFGIYKMVTAQTFAERAAEKYKKQMEEQKALYDDLKRKSDEYIAVMRSETATRFMQTKAFKEFIQLHPAFAKTLTLEKIQLMSILELQRMINEEIDKRKYEEAEKTYNDALAKVNHIKQTIENLSKEGYGYYSQSLAGQLRSAEEELKEAKSHLDQFKTDLKDSETNEVKIISLKNNITSLEKEIATINRLLDASNGWDPGNILNLRLDRANKRLSANQAELKKLEGDQNQSISKNKAYWEKIKKDAESVLDEIDSDILKKLRAGNTKGIDKDVVSSYSKAVKEINEATTKLKIWDTSKTGNEKVVESVKKIGEMTVDAQLEAEKARVDAMADGRKKRLKEIELEYNQTLAAIDKNEKAIKDEYKTAGYDKKLESLAKQMKFEFGNSNADLLARPVIDTAKLIEKGWKEAGEGIATVFSSQYGIKDASGKEREILVSPILPDGSVLSPEELDNYIDTVLAGSSDILNADDKKIVLAIDVDPDGSAGERLHQLQDQYYALATPFTSFQSQRNNASDKRDKSTEIANKQYSDEVQELFSSLGYLYENDSLVFMTEQQKKENEFKQSIAKMRKTASDMLAGGTITPEIFSDYSDAIDAYELNSLVEKYKTTENKINDIIESSNAEIAKLRKNGREKEAQEAEKARDKEISQITADELQNSEEWISLFNNIDRLSAKAILKAVEKLKVIASENLKAGKLTAEEYANVMNTLDNAGDGAKTKNPFSNFIDNFKKLQQKIKDEEEITKKDWKDLAESAGMALQALGEIVKEVSSFADALGADEILTDKLNNIAGALGGIGQAAISFSQGDVLGGIKGVFSGLTSIVNLFNNDKKHEKNIKKLQDQVDALDRSYSKLGKSIETAYSTDASKLIEQQNQVLKQQKAIIQQQIDEEESKKKTDKDRIKEWKNKLEDIDEAIADNKIKAQDAIFGADVQSAIDDLTNSLVNAWGTGADEAASMKEVVRKMIRGVIVEMIKMDLKPTVQAIRDKIQAAMVDGIISEYEQKEIDRFVDEALNAADKKYSWAEKYMKDEESANQSSTSKGFQAMSQDTGDELNGRFTAMQSILMKSLDVQTTMKDTGLDMRNIAIQSKDHLYEIAKNTRELGEMNLRLKNIEENTRLLK